MFDEFFRKYIRYCSYYSIASETFNAGVLMNEEKQG